MAQIILLSDNSTKSFLAYSRYMGPYVLATALEKSGYSVVVIDQFTKCPNFFEYLKNFIGPETLLVGLSTTFLYPKPEAQDATSNENDMFASDFSLWCSTAAELKNWLGELRATLDAHSSAAKIILGGARVGQCISAHRPPDLLFQYVDYFSFGLGELQIQKVVESVRSGADLNVVNYNGLKILALTDDLKPKDCPETIFSNRHAIQLNESLPIEVSRGCVFNCKFCYYEKQSSTLKDLNQLKSEFIRNYELFGTTTYHFCDDCFNDSRKKVETLCHLILSLPFKIEWISYARADLAIRFPETLDLMIESGASGLYFGIESLNSGVARKAGKGTPSEKVKDFLLQFKPKYGDRCLTTASFVIGLPGETIESQNETIDWVLKNAPVDFLSVNALLVTPYLDSLDKITTDFSDYSRNPEKHGFLSLKVDSQEKNDWKVGYWEHATMNYKQACEISRNFYTQWHEQKGKLIMKNIWPYPVLKTLGLNKNEIIRFARDPVYAELVYPKIIEAQKHFLENYWSDLKFNNRNIKNPALPLDRAVHP